MNCPKCNIPLDENAVFCKYCGSKVQAEQSHVSENPFPELQGTPFERGTLEIPPETKTDYFAPPAQQWQPPQPPVKKQTSPAALLVISILSVVFSALNYSGIPVVHLFGIGLGIVSVALCSKALKTKSKLVVVSLILGIVGLVMGFSAMMIGCVGSLLNTMNNL